MNRHQRGYIFEAHGAYHVRYYVTVDGVRKQKSTRLCTKDRSTGHGSASAKAVRTLCEDHMRSINAELTPPSQSTIADFWEKTYLPFITENHKKATVTGYIQMWKNHLKNHFSNMALRDYRTPMGSVFLTELSKTYRPRTVSLVKCVASCMFVHALNTGYVDSNPMRDVHVLGKSLPHGEQRIYSLEEIGQVLNALVSRPDAQLMMGLAFFLGLRKGEIQGLQWGDIDADYCHVRRAFSVGVLGTPKTKRSLRSVPLIAPVRVLLGLWRRRSDGGVWIFPSTRRGKAEVRDLGQFADLTIRPLLRAAGVPWKGFHGGRRGLGTALRALTGNSNAGKGVLGHVSTMTTEQHYEGLMPEEAVKGMKLLEEKVNSSL